MILAFALAIVGAVVLGTLELAAHVGAHAHPRTPAPAHTH
jgi:hypothetical protein